MSVQAPNHIACPTPEELRKLMRGRLSGDRVGTVTTHLDDCRGCQTKIELLAEGETNLSDVVKHIDQLAVPDSPAFQQAMQAVQGSLTSTYAAVGTPAADILEFLRPTNSPDRIGKIGEFEVIREIGRGGMGIVLQAYDPQLEREVAIKVLDPKLANNETARSRFCREARAAAAVSHENLVAVYSVHEDAASGVPYFAMQLVGGETLEQRIRREGKLSVDALTRIAWQAAQGLAAAHAGGLIHRDIKPGNILLEGKTDRAKLTDFGLARAAEDLKLTRSGFVAGTPLYMAPEQAKGDDVDARSDLFSLGAVMYEALAGKPPFEGATPLAVLRRVADEAHPRLSRFNHDVPDWLEDAIDQLLEKDPDKRIQSATELAGILAMHFSGDACTVIATPSECTVARTASRVIGTRRHRRLATALVLTLPLLLGLGAGLLLGRGLAPAQPPMIQMVTTPTEPAAHTAANNNGPEPQRAYSMSLGTVSSLSAASEIDAIAAGYEDGTFAVWSISENKKLINQNNAHDAPITAIAISKSGKLLVTAGDDAVVKVWDISRSPEVIQTLPHPTSVRSIALDHAGSRIVTGDRSGTILAWEIGFEEPIGKYIQGGSINSLDFDPSNLSFVAVSSNRTAYIWELTTGRNTVSFTGHTGPIYGVSYSSDGEWVASVSWDRTIRIWKARTGEEVRSIPAEDSSLLSVSFSSCGKVLATGSQEGVVRVWDVENGVQRALYSRHNGEVTSVRFISGCHKLVSGGRDGFVRVWEVD